MKHAFLAILFLGLGIGGLAQSETTWRYYDGDGNRISESEYNRKLSAYNSYYGGSGRVTYDRDGGETITWSSRTYSSRSTTYYRSGATYSTRNTYGPTYYTQNNYGTSYGTINNYGDSHLTINNYGSGGTTVNDYGSGRTTVNRRGRR